MDKLSRAIRLKMDIKALEEERADLEKQLRALESDIRPKPVYGDLQVKCEMRGGKEVVYLVDYLLNEADKDQHLHLFGYVNGDWKESRRSVGYYRTDEGILTHGGGGWILLNSPVLCSDEEWEAIKAGNIPDKFKRNID